MCLRPLILLDLVGDSATSLRLHMHEIQLALRSRQRHIFDIALLLQFPLLLVELLQWHFVWVQ